MKPPAFQFYARDWLSSTLGMPWDVAGVYIHLLAWSWDNGPLPDDAKWRARVLGSSTPQAHARLWKAVCSRWVKTPAGWINPRLEQQRALQASFQKRAQKGANARWQASPKQMLNRWPASASASASAEDQEPTAPRSVPFKVYAAIAKAAVKETATDDLGEIAEAFKKKCAQQGLPYDADLVTRALKAARAARRRA